MGNRLSSLNVTQYNYNASNELTSTPTLTYSYDSAGNLKSKSDGTTYNWDYENRLTKVVLPGTGGTVSFKYDAFGRRAQKSFVQGSTTTTTNYLYDGETSSKKSITVETCWPDTRKGERSTSRSPMFARERPATINRTGLTQSLR